MRPVILAAAMSLLLALGAHAEEKWETFRSETGHFSISAPGEPAEEAKTQETPLGPVDRTNLVWRAPEATYAVAFSDLPVITTALGAKPVFLQVKQGFRRQTGAEVSNERDFRFEGFPGHQLDFVMPGKDGAPPRAGRARAILVDSRLYVLTASWPQEEAPEDAGRGFFTSFQLSQ